MVLISYSLITLTFGGECEGNVLFNINMSTTDQDLVIILLILILTCFCRLLKVWY